ncbi:MAG: glycosyltransferase family 2 protein [candidate division WOR-3 bacterium]|uniref:Glycosyltransferase family 2 protein n=1 Tax=candidate division WOR-3 bacterium TaxID=2052148 RepID=A0A7C3EYE8_UNCW3|nr:glycosyltransferase family 2 protein [candidate division WOR-3 bacterium]
MKLSIVIVTFNSAADIEACLKSVRPSVPYEVIVIDNASLDRTRQLLEQAVTSGAHPQLCIIHNPANYGYARANNQGIALARGEYILLLNPDTVLFPDAVDRMVEYLDRHPEVAGVAPRLLNPDGTTQLSIRSFPTFSSVLWELTGLPRLFPDCSRLNRWRRRDFDYEKPQYAEQPMASCLLLRRSILVALGGFDERFPIYYNDVDLCYRIYQQGGRLAYLPEARVYHKLGASTSPLRIKMIYENHRSLFRFLRKHNRKPSFILKGVILLPLLELSALLRVLLFRLKKIVSR